MTQTSATTELIPTPDEPARRQLTDDEILTEFGPLIWEALIEFGRDPMYAAEMAEAAAAIDWKQQVWDARAEAKRRGASDEDVPALTEEILAERGHHRPAHMTPVGERRRGRTANVPMK